MERKHTVLPSLSTVDGGVKKLTVAPMATGTLVFKRGTTHVAITTGPLCRTSLIQSWADGLGSRLRGKEGVAKALTHSASLPPFTAAPHCTSSSPEAEGQPDTFTPVFKHRHTHTLTYERAYFFNIKRNKESHSQKYILRN